MLIAVLSLVVTVCVYACAKKFYRFQPRVYLTPLLTTPVVVIVLLLWTKVPYDSYNAGAKWLSDMIGPATVAFAVPLYKNFAALKKHAAEIIVSVLVGSGAAILSSVWLAEGLHLNMQIVDSLAPRSATTSIAMSVSRTVGGIPTITAVFVLLTGVLGMIIGPILIKVLRIRDDISRGVLLGTGSHNAGTSKAFEFSPVSGTIASISMILTAFFTLCLAPWLL